jgi:2-oxoglutarate dehydrogenase E2 component (dihydrolipoamide succinyltransferase)
MAIEVKVPELGESISEVTIADWLKSPGDYVELDEPLVELESDKATVELPSPSAGKLLEVRKNSGDTATIDEILAMIDETAEAPAGGAAAPPATSSDTPAATPAAPSTPPQPSAPPAGPARVMPAAERALARHGLDADQVTATGPGGRLLKEDVQRHVSRQGAGSAGEPAVPTSGPTPVTPPPPRPELGARQDRRKAMSPIRRRIAERLVEAQHTAALLTTFNEIDMTEVIALRRQHQDAFVEKYGIKLGFMSFFTRATIEALREIPQINAEIDGTDLVYHEYYDIGIAIGSGKGLAVPVLRNAEMLSLAGIELAIADFSARAQANKLDLEELRGGTFTISNGGVYGSLLSTPIVNPPQSGILGLHKIEDRPVAIDGQVVIRPMMYVALTYDHRVVDGREAVTFLKLIKERIEDPARLFLEI